MKPTLASLSLWLAALIAHPALAETAPAGGKAASAPKRYLVVVNHSAEDCLEALHGFEQKDRPLFQKVEWGCADGVHTGWVHVEAPSAKAAVEKLPAASRDSAKAVRVETFNTASERKLKRTLDAERALNNED